MMRFGVSAKGKLNKYLDLGTHSLGCLTLPVLRGVGRKLLKYVTKADVNGMGAKFMFIFQGSFTSSPKFERTG